MIIRGFWVGFSVLALQIQGDGAQANSLSEISLQGESAPLSEPDNVEFNPGIQQSVQSGASDYRLGPGDVLDVRVFAAEDYSGEVIVIQNGAINLPRVGQVFVEGLTLQQTINVIAEKYSAFIREPIVDVQPVQFRPVRIGIAGEVKRPGSYVVSGIGSVGDADAQNSRFPTLTEAIGQAGGITAEANLREIEVRRNVDQGQEQVITVDLWNLVLSGNVDQDVILQSGDEVIIPTATALTPEESTTLANASFAPDTIQVYVTGEVEDPGAVAVPLNTPLNQAVLAAGGFNSRANQGTVELVRINANGTASQEIIDVDLAAGAAANNNPVLKDQDVIVVRRSGVARIGDVTDILLSPVTRVLNTILGLERLLD